MEEMSPAQQMAAEAWAAYGRWEDAIRGLIEDVDLVFDPVTLTGWYAAGLPPWEAANRILKALPKQ